MVENNPMVSVMILCYNYGSMLGRALNACANQTYKNFELVMINNGSTDDTEEVYQRFCGEHPEIKTTYVHVNPNEGPCHGWNEGLRQARGVYVMFNDADDWMEPECLELLVERARESDADRVMGQYREVLPNGTVVRVRKLSKRKHRMQLPMFQAAMFRRSTILENNLFIPEEKEKWAVYDHWFVFNFISLEKNKGVFVYDRTVYNYYYNPESVYKQMTKWNVDDRMSRHIRPAITQAADVLKRISDKRLHNEIVYWTAKAIYFAGIMYTTMYLPKEEASKFHALAQKIMRENLPDYCKNPMVWFPFGNGDELIGSIACMGIITAEVLHSEVLIQLMAKLFRLNSSSRYSKQH